LQHVGEVVLGRGQRRDGARDWVATLRQSCHQLLQLVNAGVELGALLIDGAEHGVQVVDHVADELVSGSEVLGERAGVGQQVRQRATLTLQQLEDGVAHLVDLAAVEAFEHRSQSAEQRIEIQRGLGVLLRNRRARRQLAELARTGRDLQIAVTDQVFVADHGPSGRVQLITLVDVECDINGVVGVQRDLVDGSHRDTGDPDILTRLQPRRVGERRVVSLVGGEPELAEHDHEESRNHQHHHREDGDLEKRPVARHQYSSLSANAPLNRN
jgi:hypothetical protein